jgi:hypothetical protein
LVQGENILVQAIMIPTINNNPEKYGTGKKTTRGKALGDAC